MFSTVLGDVKIKALRRRIMNIGFEIAKRYVSQALRWGYVKALSWIRDEAYIFHLGISYINTPPTYRYETIKAEYVD